jgi:quercetin dioxygenase-like cupin family protein
MIIKTSPGDAPRVNAPVDGRIMYTEERFEAILLALAPGENMSVHRNPFDVLFVGISGQAILVTEGSRLEISAGESIFVTAEETRGWENHSAETCRMMVVKLFTEKLPA